MRKSSIELLLAGSLIAAGCASGDMAHSPRDPSHSSATSPLPSGVGVLAADFDPERVAPAATAGGDDPHAGHHMEAGHEMGEGAKAAPDPAATVYTCPHHPEVVSDEPGACPKCGMDLVPRKPPAGVAPAGEEQAPPANGTDHSGHEGH